ncbi:MAG: hypothetical protein ACWA44_06695 [Thiotrichales bacterium]
MGKIKHILAILLISGSVAAVAEDKAGIALLSDTNITETEVEAPATWSDQDSADQLQSEIEQQTAENEALRKRVAELEKAVEDKGLSTEEISQQIQALKSQVEELEKKKSQ